MRLGVLGTGVVGTTIATRLVVDRHEVCMGAREADNPRARAWTAQAGQGAGATHGTFADAAAFGQSIFNCTAGVASLEALRRAGAAGLRGKILVDVANPRDFSHGMPPTLTVCNTDSLGEQIQRAFPDVRSVKALNTVNHLLMVNPGLVPGEHHLLLCGNDAGAKDAVTRLLLEWGWEKRAVLDLGDMTAARGMEMVLPLWIRLWSTLQTARFNFHIVRGAG